MGGIQWGRVSPDLKATKIVIVGSGTSLKGFDFNRLNRDDYYTISINDSVKGVPFANAWFTLDPWGLEGPQLPKEPFAGKLFAAVPQDYGRRDAKNPAHRVVPKREITYLQRLISNNLEEQQSTDMAFLLNLAEDVRCISTGNSGYGAFNIAYHLRPQKILLLGLDAGMGYFYTPSKSNRPLSYLPRMFNSTQKQIEEANIEVINGSKNSKILTYPRFSIDEALELFDAN